MIILWKEFHHEILDNSWVQSAHTSIVESDSKKKSQTIVSIFGSITKFLKDKFRSLLQMASQKLMMCRLKTKVLFLKSDFMLDYSSKLCVLAARDKIYFN